MGERSIFDKWRKRIFAPVKYDLEINKRRTFAIISHPDAGKTTLTEKFFFCGAIQTAGAVSNKIKNSPRATSWRSKGKEVFLWLLGDEFYTEYPGKPVGHSRSQGFCRRHLPHPYRG